MRLRPLARANAPAPGWRLLHAGAAALMLAACVLAAPIARAQGAAPVAPAKATAITRPLWTELKPEQQEALRPLAPHWEELAEAHKRKWIALSRNYADMSPEGRNTLHSRMSDWASLSFQQRAQARLNFAEIQRLAADERKAKWEAYQALSEEERVRLAKRATPQATGAAVAVQPVPARKLAPIPAVAPAEPRQRPPRIQLAPPAAKAAALAQPPEAAAAAAAQ